MDINVNGLMIPEDSKKVVRIADPIGGHLYTITTSVSVEIGRLDEVQGQIASLQKDIEEKSALLAELQASAAVLPAPAEMVVDESATSTPAHL